MIATTSSGRIYKMKSTLTWWGGLSKPEVSPSAPTRRACRIDATQPRSIRTNSSPLCLCQGPDPKWKNSDWSSLLNFDILSSLVDPLSRRPVSYINKHHPFAEPYIISPFLQFVLAGVSPLEVKYDIFRNEYRENWQKLMEWYSQHNIVDP